MKRSDSMNKEIQTITISVIVNTILSIVKIIAGFIGKSGALIADGIHSFSDLVTDFFVIIGSKLSRKPADNKHPYGHGKIEYIICIVIGLIILFLGMTIIYSSIGRKVVIPSILVLIVSIFTIISKFVLSEYILIKGRQYSSNVLIASGLESRTDVISSIVVMLSVIFAHLSKYNHIFVYSDIIASIIVGVLIIKVGFNICTENISSILGEQVTDPIYLDKIKQIIQNKKILSIDKIMILKYGPFLKLTVEIGMNENEKLKNIHKVIDQIENNVKNFDKSIDYVIIHVNPYKESRSSNE